MHATNQFVWSEESQFDYIQECRKIYISYYYNKPNKKDWVLQELYFEGFENGALKLAFDEFKDSITTDKSKWSNRYNFSRSTEDSAFYRRHKIDFRQGMKYVRNPNHKKKSRSEKEDARQSWRKAKGLDKDKQKAGYRRDGCPPFLKRVCNKAHRAWIRSCIEKEDFDALGGWNWKRKDIFDPWMWD